MIGSPQIQEAQVTRKLKMVLHQMCNQLHCSVSEEDLDRIISLYETVIVARVFWIEVPAVVCAILMTCSPFQQHHFTTRCIINAMRRLYPHLFFFFPSFHLFHPPV